MKEPPIGSCIEVRPSASLRTYLYTRTKRRSPPHAAVVHALLCTHINTTHRSRTRPRQINLFSSLDPHIEAASWEIGTCEHAGVGQQQRRRRQSAQAWEQADAWTRAALHGQLPAPARLPSARASNTGDLFVRGRSTLTRERSIGNNRALTSLTNSLN